jgi:hypothetical protein
VDRTIAPGRRERIEVSARAIPRFNSSVTTGEEVSLCTNDPDEPYVYLSARAKLLYGLRVEPTVHFGLLARNAGPESRTITLTRGDAGPVDPKVVEIDTPNVAADVVEIEAGELYELTVTIAPPWPRGMSGHIALATGVPEQPNQSITVYVSFEPRLSAETDQFLVPQQRTRTLVLEAPLRWSDEAPPGNILGVSVVPSQMLASIEDRAGQSVVMLTIPPNCPPPAPRPGQSAYAVTVRTDDPAVPVLRIRIYFTPDLGPE